MYIKERSHLWLAITLTNTNKFWKRYYSESKQSKDALLPASPN